ncbi:hereditary hemochromatosis protein homolog isoform X1 [Ctenopharyngodon idella]|uniref:hereditary hemochromatosis protein homolog isoform X1 n=1 Tax=Ctenopharyngodon idella TaxID=7959 RepID=UPI00222E7B5A|nr:hereditary hemochromatosis protein homolog isoform X1 [Ctenopharyngodon idella]
MASIKVLLLISAISSSQSEMHSLYYMYSVISKSLMSGEMFEFYTSVELSDIQMSLCKSVNKADFMSQLCEESERLFNESDDLHYKQQWLQINLKTLMMEHKRKENSTRDTDLHVLQWRHGCAVERHSNGSVMFLQGTDEYAYDGQTLTFDLSMHWKPLVLDHDIIWDRESVSSLERKCVETLTSFTDLQLEGKFIMESRPDVHTLVKASGSSVKQLLVCLATGFYPKHVQMEIRHNQTPLPDEQLNSDGIRPNADGSFQLMKSLEILPSERAQYRCVVEDQTVIEPQFIRGNHDSKRKDEGNVLLLLLIGLIVVLVVIAIILLVFFLLRKCVKRRTLELDCPPLDYDIERYQALRGQWLEPLHKTQMQPELLKEITLNTDLDDKNPTDPSMEEVHTEEVHDTQSLCDTEATPAAARGAMGSKIISLPNFDEGNVLLLLLIGLIVALVALAIIILLVFYLLRKCVKRRNLSSRASICLRKPVNEPTVHQTPTDYLQKDPINASAMGSKIISLPNFDMQRRH